MLATGSFESLVGPSGRAVRVGMAELPHLGNPVLLYNVFRPPPYPVSFTCFSFQGLKNMVGLFGTHCTLHTVLTTVGLGLIGEDRVATCCRYYLVQLRKQSELGQNWKLKNADLMSPSSLLLPSPPLPLLNRVQVIKDGKKRKLVINGCKLEDAGKITCKTNADEASADLGVKCESTQLASLTPSHL